MPRLLQGQAFRSARPRFGFQQILILLLLSTMGAVQQMPSPEYLIVSDMSAGKVYQVDLDGQKTVLATLPGSQPHSIATNASGEIFVADVVADRIWRISGGITSTYYQFGSVFDNPEAIVFDPSGNLYVAGTIESPSTTLPNRIYQVTPAQVGSVYAQAGNQENPGLARDAAGNLYMTDLGNGGALWKIDIAQQATLLASDLGYATGVTIAPDGVTVLVAARLENKIWSIAPGGAKSTFATISLPWSLAFDPAGDLYVGQDTGISKIASGGAQTVIATGINDVRGLVVIVPEPIGFTAIGLLMLLLRRGKHEKRGRD